MSQKDCWGTENRIKKDIELLTQDLQLDDKRKKVAGLKVEVDWLKKSKGFR